MLRINLIILLFLAASCSEPYLYDKIGFAPGQRPKNYWNPKYPARFHPPDYRNPAKFYGSRFYSNPYAIDQSRVHDFDQHYYPPNNYYNMEQMQLYQLHKALLPDS